MTQLLVRLWRLLGSGMKWRALWVFNAKFIVGVTGIVRNESGQVLLLKHRFWPPRTPWGMPSGYVCRNESFEQAIIREVREETGLDVVVEDLVRLQSGLPRRIQAAYFAALVGGELTVDSREILAAQWFAPDQLPQDVLPGHRLLLNSITKMDAN